METRESLRRSLNRDDPEGKQARREAFMLELTPVLMRDPDDRILFWNRAAEVLYGFTKQEALGRQSHELLKTKFPEPLEQIMARVRTGRQWTGELRHVRSDGSEVVVASQWIAYLDSGGKLETIIEVNREVTEWKQAEEARDRLAAIIENSEDAIISKNLDGIITSWNRGAEKLLGYTAKEMIGQPISRIIPPDQLAEEARLIERLRAGETIEHFETVRLTKSGRPITVSLRISPVRDPAGVIVGASKIARDISERIRTERALREAQADLKAHAQNLEHAVATRTAQLRETVAELEAFSYSLSHDLRAPLRAINTFTQIILEDYTAQLPAEVGDLLNKIIEAAKRMDRLMQDVLAFSRVSRQPMELMPLNVEGLVREVLSRPELNSAQAEIIIDSPLEQMFGNSPSLSQCLINLLGNALKFVAPGVKPRVRISTERRGDWVRLWIADNGIGMAKAEQGRIFEIFHRLRSEYEGTGIGLAIVKKAAERMGGRVGVESEPGKGSRFWLELPAVKGEQAATAG